jgi:hypothetical protein
MARARSMFAALRKMTWESVGAAVLGVLTVLGGIYLFDSVAPLIGVAVGNGLLGFLLAYGKRKGRTVKDHAVQLGAMWGAAAATLLALVLLSKLNNGIAALIAVCVLAATSGYARRETTRAGVISWKPWKWNLVLGACVLVPTMVAACLLKS